MEYGIRQGIQNIAEHGLVDALKSDLEMTIENETEGVKRILTIWAVPPVVGSIAIGYAALSFILGTMNLYESLRGREKMDLDVFMNFP